MPRYHIKADLAARLSWYPQFQPVTGPFWLWHTQSPTPNLSSPGAVCQSPMVLATLLIDLLVQAAPLGQQLLSPPLPLLLPWPISVWLCSLWIFSEVLPLAMLSCLFTISFLLGIVDIPGSSHVFSFISFFIQKSYIKENKDSI